MTIRRTLVGQPVEKPSGAQIRKKIKQSKTIKGFRMRPGYVYTVVRAISARINQNYDGWPSDELKLSYHTFLGKPVFVNHTNEDPNTARGVVVASRYIENGNDKYIECVQEIDAQRYPKVASEIITGGLDSVSMGAEAGFTICSYCNNRAIDEYDLCDHVKYHKGSTLRKFNQRTGKTEDVLVYESCHKLSFFELSYVFDPADETAVASKVLVANRKTAAGGDVGSYWNWYKDQHPEGVSPQSMYDFATWHDRHIQPGQKQQVYDTVKDQEAQENGGQMPPWTDRWDHTFGPEDDDLDAWHDVVGHPDKQKSRGGIGTVGPEGEHRFQGLPITQPKGHNAEDWDPDAGQDPFDPRLMGASYTAAVLRAAGIKTAKCHYCDTEAEEGFKSCPSHRAMELNKFTKGGALDCPPGADCGADDPTDPNVFDPAAATTTDSTSSSSSTSSESGSPATPPSGGNPDASGILPQARPLYDSILESHPGLDIGGYREDEYHEHDSGALDVMTSDPAVAADVRAKAFEQGAPYVLWQQKQWNADGSVSPMEDRGDPTQNHMDHVHTAPFTPKASPNPAGKTKTTSFEHQVLHLAGFYPEGRCNLKTAGATEDYLEWQRKVESGEIVPEKEFPQSGGGPSPAQQRWLQHMKKRLGFEERVLMTAGFGKQAWGEIQAPTAVDTLRGEGSATGDDTEDFHHYVESPDDLKGPDTSEAAQLDREQAEGGDEPPMEEPPAPPQQQYMTLQIPIPLQQESPPPQVPMMPQPVQTADPLQGPVPGQQPGGGALPPAAGGVPPQPQQPPQQMAASFTARTANAAELAYFERYFGHRIANWRDAIVANRPMTPEEGADYRRARGKFLVSSTLEKIASVSTTSRTSEKGSANMARSTLAERGKVASQGRRRHYAEGPLVDTGDQSRNDQGEQEDAFITRTPPPEHTPLPDDDTHNISNTENNLVAKVQRGREQLLRDAQALASLQQQKLAWDDDSDYFAPKDKYRDQRDRGRYNPSPDEFDSDDEYDAFQRNRVAGVDGDADKVVNPTLPQPSANELKGDHFEAVEETPTPTRTTSSAVNDNSLKIFQAFDQWLAKATGKASRDHDEATIKRGAAEFAKRAKFNPQEMFPALGIVLREARKNDTRKAAAMRRQSDQGNQSLNVAAPDERIDVEAPQANVTNPKAQSSQFDANDFDNNSSKSKAKPDTSTDSQFWYPGGGNKGTKRRKPTGAQEKTAGALLGMRCAEAMIAAGLEPNDRERRYQLATEFQEMSRGAILDRTALAERFAAVRQADHQHYQQQVASGKSRGAARSPIPPGLSQGVSARTAATYKSAANDPSNDSLLFS